MNSQFYLKERERKVEKKVLLLLVMKHHDFQLQPGMLAAYVLVNVVRLFAPHPAVRTLKPRWAAALELAVAQHVMQVLITPSALRASIPDASLTLLTKSSRWAIVNTFTAMTVTELSSHVMNVLMRPRGTRG